MRIEPIVVKKAPRNLDSSNFFGDKETKTESDQLATQADEENGDLTKGTQFHTEGTEMVILSDLLNIKHYTGQFSTI